MPISLHKDISIKNIDSFMYEMNSNFKSLYDNVYSKVTPSDNPISVYDIIASTRNTVKFTLTNSTNVNGKVWVGGKEYTTFPLDIPQSSFVRYKLEIPGRGIVVGETILNNDFNIDCSTVTINTYTYTINPTPSDSSVSLTVSGSNPYNFVQSGKSIIVSKNTVVNYSVSKTEYETQSGSKTITSNTTDNITLTIKKYTLTVNPTPSDATVTLTATGYTQSGKTITVPKGTVVSYTVSKSGYVTQSGTYTVNSAYTLNITLVQMFTLTVSTSPSDATVTLAASGYTQSGNTITVPKGTNVVWMVEKTGYVTQNGTYTVNSNYTMNVTLEEEGENVDVTGYEYTNTNMNLVLTKYIGTSTNVKIPNI